MFQTYSKHVYYKCEDDTWFARKNHGKLFAGWRCIGSIDLSNMLEEDSKNSDLLAQKTCEQLQKGPPKDFIPYFKLGNHSLIIKNTSKQYLFSLGTAITEVYNWL